MIRPNAVRGDVVPYDFRRPSRISADRHRTLTASHEQLAQAIQRWVSTRLRSSFEVRLESVAQKTYGEFVGSLDDPSAAFLYRIREQPGVSIAVHLDRRIAFLLVEKLLGASVVSEVPERALTQLESVVVRVVTDRIAREISEVWKDHVHFDLEFSRFESARELIELTTREEDILLITLQVSMTDVRGLIQCVLPFPALETFFSPRPAVRSGAAARPANEIAVERRAIEEAVRRARVTVSARLPRFRTTLGRLASLRPGDLLTVDASLEEPVEVLVADKTRFRARLGKVGDRLGVQITRSADVD
jgi:flagellar motor switch protein FliM